MTQQTEDLTYIAPNLRQHAVPIDEPQSHPDNKRLGDVENIKRSITRFGQVRPVMQQESTGYIVAGNHTRKAMQELGLSHIAVIAVPMDDEEALAYLVADNRLAELGGYDDAGLNANLEKLMLAGKLEGTGFTPDEVDDRLAAMDALPEVEPADEQAQHGTTNEELAQRFANRSQSGPLRQFVLMYPQETGTVVEGQLHRLGKAWGITKTADVVTEALRRCLEDPPVAGLTDAEKALADAPDPEPEPATEPQATTAMPDPEHNDPVPTPEPEAPGEEPTGLQRAIQPPTVPPAA
jgi:hypothetical protein